MMYERNVKAHKLILSVTIARTSSNFSMSAIEDFKQVLQTMQKLSQLH